MVYHVGLTSSDPLLTKKDWFYNSKEWECFLLEDPKEMESVRKCTKTARPLGNKSFIENGAVANQNFRRIFRNSNFFETLVHLGKLTFQKN